MLIMTANLNGIRSADSKGFFNWALNQIKCDVICLQEIKADIDSIPDHLKDIPNYHTFYHPAKKKGYSGVGIITRKKPNDIIIGLGNEELDNEGRYIELIFDNFAVCSLYFPSGSSGEDKQQKKFRAMDFYLPILQAHIKNKKPVIICGDWNIAHKEIDLKNWRSNRDQSGFLPEEREWIDQIFTMGYIDTWRYLYPDVPGYTWWSHRGNAYIKDAGWRIDYHVVSPDLKHHIKQAYIYKDQKFSDHAPLIVEYKLD
jgi:exodeoxyribonuclease-3